MMTTPRSTYRLQLNYQFPLQKAGELVIYLNQLGISTLYLSPLLKARSKSTHCYDVVDPSQLNPELGSSDDLDNLSGKLHKHNMSILLDIVPNHMYIKSNENTWWNDLLTYGKESTYSRYFDIFWEEVASATPPQLVLPFLGQSLQEEIDQKHLILNKNPKQLSLKYHHQTFPLINVITSERNDLSKLLAKQFYCLKQWSEGNKELQYRRFFDVSELACMRVEDPSVFEATHRQILHWLKRGTIQGVRIDHIDGLNDPEEYIKRIQSVQKDVYIVAEKIFTGNETGRVEWGGDGTTGYDFLNELNQLFLYPDSFQALTSIYNRFTGNTLSPDEIILQSKMQVMDEVMIPEVRRLTKALHEELSDTSMETCSEAIKALVAAFPVYRTYISKGTKQHPVDMTILNEALDKARKISQKTTSELWDKLKNIFIDQKNERFVSLFQQTTGPIMAKGVEDTALYRFYPLCSLNEVGGELYQEELPIQKFHEKNLLRNQFYPKTLLATSTHDTKRSEDVRARINVLSEIPDQWEKQLLYWHGAFNPQKAIEPQHEYLLYQTLIGTWISQGSIKSYRERIATYMLKAVKEEKRVTSWINPNDEYETRLKSYIEGLLSADSPFIQELDDFVETIRIPAYINSLAQVLLKCTSPGVSDFYQGSELWIYNLVDPDNRGLVDFITRKKMMALLDKKPSLDAMMQIIENGLLKMSLTKSCLSLRNKYPDLFLSGSYLPLEVIGPMKDHVIAYLRHHKGKTVITVTGRFFTRQPKWDGTKIIVPEELSSAAGYECIRDCQLSFQTPSEIDLSQLFHQLPLALMELL